MTKEKDKQTGTDNTMTKRERTNRQGQTIHWQKEKGQTDRNRQYNDKKKKDKQTGTDNTMTKRKRNRNKMNNKKYHIVLKSNKKIPYTESKSILVPHIYMTTNTHIHDH